MIENKKILAIIPARSGSKGIPQKNIKSFLGKPLITRTIQETNKSRFIDKTIVSTDSEEIANLAKSNGAEAPFIRPEEYSTDNSLAKDVILHTLDWITHNQEPFHYFIYLQPTSPFRTSVHIDSALKKLIRSRASSMVAVKEVKEHPKLMKIIDRDGFLFNLMNYSKKDINRQDFENLFLINGALYISKCDVFIKHKSFYEKECMPFIMDEFSSIDLDTLEDWNFAEYIGKHSLNNI